MAVANGYAYLADTSATEIIDVSTPSRPVLVSSIATVNAQSVAVVGSRLYVLDGGLLKIFSVATASDFVCLESSSFLSSPFAIPHRAAWTAAM